MKKKISGNKVQIQKKNPHSRISLRSLQSNHPTTVDEMMLFRTESGWPGSRGLSCPAKLHSYINPYLVVTQAVDTIPVAKYQST